MTDVICLLIGLVLGLMIGMVVGSLSGRMDAIRSSAAELLNSLTRDLENGQISSITIEACRMDVPGLEGDEDEVDDGDKWMSRN